MATEPSVYDHYRADDEGADVRAGVYRVVGVDDDVTLLRVGDEDGRRVHTGEVVRVPREGLDVLEEAENPDASRSLAASLASLPETAYWSVRAFVDELAKHPVAALASVSVLLIGSLGGFLSVPDAVSGALVLFGSLALAYVGGGHL